MLIRDSRDALGWTNLDSLITASLFASRLLPAEERELEHLQIAVHVFKTDLAQPVALHFERGEDAGVLRGAGCSIRGPLRRGFCRARL